MKKSGKREMGLAIDGHSIVVVVMIVVPIVRCNKKTNEGND